MKLTLPWICLVPDNARFGIVKGKRKLFLSKRYRTAKDQTVLLAQAQVKQEPFAGLVSVLAVFYPPDKRRRDALNLGKALMDSLEGICYRDDSQIAQATFRKAAPDSANPRVEISVMDYLIA
jgi:Holliday junction resolvase RusA-like endonuclease